MSGMNQALPPTTQQPDLEVDEPFNRPPRILRVLPQDEIEIPAPPNTPTLSLPARLGFILLPAITGIFYLIALLARGGQGGNIWLSLPIVLISFASVGFGVWNYLSQRRLQEQARLAHANVYAETLEQVRSSLYRLDELQRSIREENDPDPTRVLQIALGATGRGGLPEARLWERRPTDADFLSIRIGIGNLPTSVTIKPPKANQFQYTPELRHAAKLAHEFALVRKVPVTIPLRACGSIGIAGRDVAVVGVAYAMLWQLVVHHSPRDVRIAAFWRASFDTSWEWLRWLPHTRAFDDDSYRLLARYDGDPDHTSHILEQLQRELRERIERGAEGRPHIVVILDSYPSYGTQYDLFAELIRRGRSLGFSVICLVSEVRQIPGDCGGYLALEPSPQMGIAGVGGGYLAFVPDSAPRIESEKLARTLAPVIQIDPDAQRELPRSIRFSTILDLGDLNTYDPRSFWKDPERPSDSWHPVPIGVSGPHAEQDRFAINLNEGVHGVHGMVAGTTGSGKSEFLLTFLMALAVKHSPDRLNLMLIDFKGGATFKDLETLPHTVGMVTDLAGYQAERALIAINSELDRRKQRLKHAGVSNIREYRRAALQPGHPASQKAMTNLLIVIDEFDEMVRDYPEFVIELIRVAKQGRSLGVHVLFATQQPSQVKEGLLRNLTYWIALRVTAPEDSKTMVTVPDAAYLTTETPGRGYFRVNKQVVAFQSARVTLPYQALVQAHAAGIVDATGRRQVFNDHELSLRQFVDACEITCRQYQYDPGVVPAMALNILAQYEQAVEQKVLPARAVSGDQPNDLMIIQQALGSYLTAQSNGDAAAELLVAMVEQLQGHREVETELKIICRAMEQARGKQYAGHTYRVWMAPLEPQIPLLDLLNEPPAWFTAPIGRLDYPTRAEQRSLCLDLAGVNGHVLVLGAARSGKTTFVRTLLLALAMRHSPADLWIYTIDPSGRGCGMMLPEAPGIDSQDRRLPHLADTLTAQDTTRIERLRIELENMIEERRALLRTHNADTLAQYRRRVQAEPNLPPPPPGIVIVIDNLAELVSAQPDILSTLLPMIREARPFDIVFVVTASMLKDVGASASGLFETRIALRLSDENESEQLIGKKAAASINPDQPGRGFLRTNEGPVELHVALPVLRNQRRDTAHDADDAAVRYSDLADELAHALQVVSRRHRTVQRPQPLKLLPSRIELADLLTHVAPSAIPFARDSLTLRPITLELDRGMPHLLIAGGPDSGKSEALRTLLTAMALRFTPDAIHFILVDYRRTTLMPFADIPHTPAQTIDVPIETIPAVTPADSWNKAKKARHQLTIIRDEAELVGLVIALREQLNQRVREQRQHPKLVLVINDLDLMIGQDLHYLALLAPFVMRGNDIGFHTIATATDFTSLSSSNNVIKAIRTERCGLYLGKPGDVTADIVNVGGVGTKWFKSLANTDFPPGRALALLRGRQALVQIAHADLSLLDATRPVQAVASDAAIMQTADTNIHNAEPGAPDTNGQLQSELIPLVHTGDTLP